MIDLVLLGCSGYAIVITSDALQPDSVCNYLNTRIYVFTMACLVILRCYHLILMILFVIIWVLFLLPCYFCMPESCCVRQYMMKREKAPKSVVSKLQT